MEQTSIALYLALLSILPHSRATPCMHARSQAIARMAAAAEQDHGVPAGILLVVGLMETHCGCDVGEGGGWGAPIDDAHRHVAGTSDTAAFALHVAYYGGGRRHFAGCHTWTGAIGRFRSGLCAPFNPVHRAYVARVVRWVERVYTVAGIPAPVMR